MKTLIFFILLHVLLLIGVCYASFLLMREFIRHRKEQEELDHEDQDNNQNKTPQ